MAANLDKLKMVKDISRKEIVFRLARFPGSEKLIIGDSAFQVSLLDLAEAKPESTVIGSHASYVNGLCLAGNIPVSGGYEGSLIWWDVEKKTPIRSVAAHAKWVRNLVASPDGKRIASVADDMACKIWDAVSGQLVHDLRGHAPQTPHDFPSMLYAVAFSPDGKFVATGDKVGHVVVWDVATGKSVATLETPVMYTWDKTQRLHSIGGIRSLAFSPDGTLLAVGGMGKVGNIDHLEAPTRLEVFDWKVGKRTHEFPGDKYKGLIERLLFHPQGDWLMAVGGDHGGSIQFFDLKANKVIRQEKVATHVHDAVLNEAADMAYLVGHQKITVWSLKG